IGLQINQCESTRCTFPYTMLKVASCRSKGPHTARHEVTCQPAFLRVLSYKTSASDSSRCQ
ncbi:uncharacterized protein V6R79_005836, partial [Siganus canaliculatus]